MGKIKSALESAASMRRKNLMLFDFEPHILCCENGVMNLLMTLWPCFRFFVLTNLEEYIKK
jgi:hypothetical protein